MSVSAVAAKFALDVGEDLAKQGILGAVKRIGTPLRSLRLTLWHPNGEARISIAALLRLRRSDGKFAIVRSKHRAENFSPIGGCFKYFAGETRDHLDRFEFKEEFEIRDDDVCCDLRGYTKRRHIGAVRSWFKTRTDQRESARECLARELREELTQEFAIIPRKFPFDDLRFRFSHSYEMLRKDDFGDRIVTHFKYFEVHNLEASKASARLADLLSNYEGPDLIWVTALEIGRGRSAGTNFPIGAPAELLIRNKMVRQSSPPPLRSR